MRGALSSGWFLSILPGGVAVWRWTERSKETLKTGEAASSPSFRSSTFFIFRSTNECELTYRSQQWAECISRGRTDLRGAWRLGIWQRNDGRSSSGKELRRKNEETGLGDSVTCRLCNFLLTTGVCVCMCMCLFLSFLSKLKKNARSAELFGKKFLNFFVSWSACFVLRQRMQNLSHLLLPFLSNAWSPLMVGTDW